MEQPVFSALEQIVEYLGSLLIIIILFWRFLMPTKVSHLPLGFKVYNIEYQIFVYRAMLHLLVAVGVIIFLEKPELVSERILSLRQLITNNYIIYILYGIGLTFFSFSIFGFYMAFQETPKMIPLTQTMKDKDYNIFPSLYKFIEGLSRLSQLGLAFLSIFSFISLFLESPNSSEVFTINFAATCAYLIQQVLVIVGSIHDSRRKQLIGLFATFLGYYLVFLLPLYISNLLKETISSKYPNADEGKTLLMYLLVLGVFIFLLWICYKGWVALKSKSKYLKLADEYAERIETL